MTLEKRLLTLEKARAEARANFFEGPHPDDLTKVYYALGKDAAQTDEIAALQKLLNGNEDDES